MARKKNKQATEVTEIENEVQQITVKQAMIKALVLTGRHVDENEAIKAMSERDDERGEFNAVDPILDPDALLSLWEISDSLRQNVEAYAHNIEGNGHVLKPKIDLSEKNHNAFDQVKDAMDAASWSDAVTAKMAELDRREEEGEEISVYDRQKAIDDLVVSEPTEKDVNAEMERLRLAMKRDKHMADAWFRNVNPTMSFLELREQKRIDEEAVGRAAWEVGRDSRGMIRRLEPISGHTILPLKEKNNAIEVERDEWISDIGTNKIRETVKFRRYVHRANGEATFFKDLNDPRLVSDKTGKVYMKKRRRNNKDVLEPDYAKMKVDEPEASPARELIYFSVYSPKTTAGMIRWAGHITGILGSRAAAESTLAYFENHAVPDSVLLISGGQLNDMSVERIQEMMRARTQKAKNHHRTLVVQAAGTGKARPNEVTNNPDMEWKNLADFQQGDALFMNYTEENKKALSSAFRQALLLIGQIPSDLNRATAMAILSLVEKQVYGPLRRKFDWWVNNTLLPAIGIKLLKFESLSPEAQNIEEMANAIEYGVKGGAFTPNILLELYGLWLNREFPKIEEPWGDAPFAATLNQIDLGVERPSDVDGDTTGTIGGGKDTGLSRKALENRLAELEKSFADLYQKFRTESEIAAGF